MSNWMEPDYYYDIPERKCSSCEECEKKESNYQDYMGQIVGMLFGKEKLDLKKLNENLHDMCSEMDVRIPNKEIQSLNIVTQ